MKYIIKPKVVSKPTFNFNIVAAAKVEKKKLSKPKVVSRLIKGICRKIESDYKIEYNGKLYDITKESYNIKGVKKIFTKEPDSKGRYTSLIRNEEFSYAFPASEEIYTRFCRKHVYEGYLVKIEDKLYFDVKDEIGIDGYGQAIIDY